MADEVMAHYAKAGDSLRLRAARFLIGNMRLHHYYDSPLLARYYARANEIGRERVDEFGPGGDRLLPHRADDVAGRKGMAGAAKLALQPLRLGTRQLRRAVALGLLGGKGRGRGA